MTLVFMQCRICNVFLLAALDLCCKMIFVCHGDWRYEKLPRTDFQNLCAHALVD